MNIHIIIYYMYDCIMYITFYITTIKQFVIVCNVCICICTVLCIPKYNIQVCRHTPLRSLRSHAKRFSSVILPIGRPLSSVALSVLTTELNHCLTSCVACAARVRMSHVACALRHVHIACCVPSDTQAPGRPASLAPLVAPPIAACSTGGSLGEKSRAST